MASRMKRAPGEWKMDYIGIAAKDIVRGLTSNTRYNGPDSYLGDDEKLEMEKYVVDVIRGMDLERVEEKGAMATVRQREERIAARGRVFRLLLFFLVLGGLTPWIGGWWHRFWTWYESYADWAYAIASGVGQ